MNIAAYCRVSTDKEDQLNSLETQKQFFTDYCARNGHNLVKLYADEGISGTKIKYRREFQSLMDDAAKRLFEMVLVKDISRFSRNTVDLLQSTRTLKSLGIETLFITANMTTLGNSEFVLTIFGALAQEESANTSKRIKFAKRINAEKGKVPNLVYGYDKIKGELFDLHINEREAAVVREIFHMYIDEGYGAHKISRALNERGLRTKRNCEWTQNAVCRILTNELYVGRVINGKQEISDFLTSERVNRDESEWFAVERPELQVIPPERFKIAGDIMSSRRKTFQTGGTRHSNRHLFSTLIKCGECGWSFRRSERTYKNTYVRWVCSCRNGKGADACTNKTSVREDVIISRLEAYFRSLLDGGQDVIKTLVSEFAKIYKARDHNQSREAELTLELGRLQKRRQKYMDMYADEIISREELNVQTGGIRTLIERCENELRLISGSLSRGERLERIISETFSALEDITDISRMTNAELRKLVQKIEVGSDGSVDIYLQMFDEIEVTSAVPFSDNHT